MMEIVEYKTESGPPLLVEVADDDRGVARAARDDKGIIRSSQHIEEALEVMTPAAEAIRANLSQTGTREITVKFGVKLSAEAGALIAKTAGEAHFEVSVTWEH